METKTYKVKLANILLLCCVAMAVHNVYLIRGHIQDYIQQEENIIEENLVYVPANIYDVPETPELPLIYKSIWCVVNMVWYLFLGGMIYANIRVNDKK